MRASAFFLAALMFIICKAGDTDSASDPLRRLARTASKRTVC